jgi:bifunctional non-homologous end joining protein LigD
VQKHAAHRLRYDVRLELDGVLKSWAVPKQPSRDPKQKRLAVHVEDHPLDDASFEGVIPARAYGAGKGEIWNAGTWAAEGDPRKRYAEGKLSFTLKGRRLSGRWALVRMRSRAREGRYNGLLIESTRRGSTPGSPSRGKKIS